MNKLTELPNLEGWNVNLLLAIMWQESKFDLNARRFEPHVFERYSKSKRKPKSYEAAKNISELHAFRAVSWGVAQIMGFNIISDEVKNNLTVRHIISDLQNNQEYQIKLMLEFIRKNKKLFDMFQNRADIDFGYVAKVYNGSGYKKNNYDVLIKEHYEQYLRNSKVIDVVQNPQNFRWHGEGLKLSQTFEYIVYDPRIIALQKKLGVVADGYFGDKTYIAAYDYWLKNTNLPIPPNNEIIAELVGAGILEQEHKDLSKPEVRKELFAGTFNNELQSKVQDEIDRAEIEKLNVPLTEEQRVGVFDDMERNDNRMFPMSDEAEQTAYVLHELEQVRNNSWFGKFLKWLGVK